MAIAWLRGFGRFQTGTKCDDNGNSPGDTPGPDICGGPMTAIGALASFRYTLANGSSCPKGDLGRRTVASCSHLPKPRRGGSVNTPPSACAGYRQSMPA